MMSKDQTPLGPDHLAVYLCSHVFEATEPIRLVCKSDGDWQFLCGGDHDADEKPHVVGLRHMIERDPSLLELADLEDGWEAAREEPDAPWLRSVAPGDEDE